MAHTGPVSGIDYKPVLDYVDVDALVQALGAERVIGALGVEQAIRTIGLERVLEVALKEMTPEQQRQLSQRLPAE
jgi:hypothetical protein